MRRQTTSYLLTLFLPLTLVACSDYDGIDKTLDVNFTIPRTENFAATLSSYGLYDGNMAELKPATGVHLYEISSKLFTDYAKKQRLVKLPEGQSAKLLNDRSADYPDGTIVAKTFWYPKDFRDLSLGHHVIETRLMIKAQGTWNVATYIWNDAQTEAELSTKGATTNITWITETGETRSTKYEIPDEVACVTCHQNKKSVSLLGLTPRNLNRNVTRADASINQLAYLQAQGVFEQSETSTIKTIIDYTDTSLTLEERARAYLDVNCAHCHQPNAWQRAAEQELDLRYETSLSKSGIINKSEDIDRLLSNGEMPLVGTTVLDKEGVALTLDYLKSL